MKNRLFCLILVLFTVLCGMAVAESDVITYMTLDTGYPVREVTEFESPVTPELELYANEVYYYGTDTSYIGTCFINNYQQLAETYGGSMTVRIDRLSGDACWLSFDKYIEEDYSGLELYICGAVGVNGTVSFRITCAIGGQSASADLTLELKTPAYGAPTGVEHYNPETINCTVGQQIVLYYPDFLPAGWGIPGQEIQEWFGIDYWDPSGEFYDGTLYAQICDEPENNRVLLVLTKAGHYTAALGRECSSYFYAYDDLIIVVSDENGSSPEYPDPVGFEAGDSMLATTNLSNYWKQIDLYFDAHYTDVRRYQAVVIPQGGNSASADGNYIYMQGGINMLSINFRLIQTGKTKFLVQLYEDGVLMDSILLTIDVIESAPYAYDWSLPAEIALEGKVGEPIRVDLSPYLQPAGSVIPEPIYISLRNNHGIASANIEGNTLLITPWYSGTFTLNGLTIAPPYSNKDAIRLTSDVQFRLTVRGTDGTVAEQYGEPPLVVYEPAATCSGSTVTVVTGVDSWYGHSVPVGMIVSLYDSEGHLVASKTVDPDIDEYTISITFEDIAPGTYYPQVNVDVMNVEYVERRGARFTVSGTPAALTVGAVNYNMSDDGKSCFIQKPVITGGTAPYTIAYNIYDSNSNAINYFYSDEEWVAATCPYDGIFNVFVVVTDAAGHTNASAPAMTGWFIVNGYSGVKPIVRSQSAGEEEPMEIDEIPEEPVEIEEIPEIMEIVVEEIPVMPEEMA